MKQIKIGLPFKSIRTTMLFSLSTLIIVTLVIFFWISMRYTEKVILDNSINYTSQLIGQVNRDIDTYIHYMENISHLVVYFRILI